MLCGYPLNEKDKEMLFRVASLCNKILLNQNFKEFISNIVAVSHKKKRLAFGEPLPFQ